jgi:hypothetical protein
MIIIKDVPGLTLAEVMSAIEDQVPLDQIETGNGGLVVDEKTAMVFLTRYLAAVGDTPTDSEEAPAKQPARRGGRKKEVEA